MAKRIKQNEGLASKIVNEYGRLMKGDNSNLIEARMFGAAVYLGLELDSDNKINKALKLSKETYRKGLVKTNNTKQYNLLEKELELVDTIPESYRDDWGKYISGFRWGEKEHESRPYLKTIIEHIDPVILKALLIQKSFSKVLHKIEWHNVDKVLKTLASEIRKREELPDQSIPSVEHGIQLAYDCLLSSCSKSEWYYPGGVAEYRGVIKDPKKLKRRIKKLEEITKIPLSKEQVVNWVDRKIRKEFLVNDADIIIKLTKLKKEDVILPKIYEGFLPRISHGTYISRSYPSNSPFKFADKMWTWIKYNTLMKPPVNKIKNIYAKMKKAKKMEGKRDKDAWFTHYGEKVTIMYPQKGYWNDKIAFLRKVTGVPVPRTK